MSGTEREINEIYKQLSVLAGKKLNNLEGWFSDTVEEIKERKTINNVCINGNWPNISWNGNKLVFE